MITGHDTVLIAADPAGGPVGRFLRRWSSDPWPAMRVSIDDSPFLPFAEHAAPPPDRAEILLAADDRMVSAWDEEGYHLSPSGDGPLMLAYEPCPASRLRMLALDDPYRRTGFAYEPYEATLVAKGISLVTIVTPDQDSDFSIRAIDALATSLETGAT